VGDLPLVTTIGIMIQRSILFGRTSRCGEEVFIGSDFRRCFGMVGTVNDPLAVGRPTRAAVITQLVSQLLEA